MEEMAIYGNIDESHSQSSLKPEVWFFPTSGPFQDFSLLFRSACELGPSPWGGARSERYINILLLLLLLQVLGLIRTT